MESSLTNTECSVDPKSASCGLRIGARAGPGGPLEKCLWRHSTVGTLSIMHLRWLEVNHPDRQSTRTWGASCRARPSHRRRRRTAAEEPSGAAPDMGSPPRFLWSHSCRRYPQSTRRPTLTYLTFNIFPNAKFRVFSQT